MLPRTVEFLPDRATATQVVLRGAFVNTAGGYTHGTGCGQMHFVCPTGSEALCRQQWEGIAAAIGTTFCQGFGTAAMATPYTLLRDGTPLASPAIPMGCRDGACAVLCASDQDCVPYAKRCGPPESGDRFRQ